MFLVKTPCINNDEGCVPQLSSGFKCNGRPAYGCMGMKQSFEEEYQNVYVTNYVKIEKN
jgi:hypothetical protein